MRYDYQAQKQRLLTNPQLASKEWFDGIGMFQFLSVLNTEKGCGDIDGTRNYSGRGSSHMSVGCLTLCKQFPGLYMPWTGDMQSSQELMQRLLEDPRIPNTSANLDELTSEQMDAFIEYQTEFDEKYRIPLNVCYDKPDPFPAG